MIHVTVWGCTESPNPEIDILVQATDGSRDDLAAMVYAQDKNFFGDNSTKQFDPLIADRRKEKIYLLDMKT